MRIDFNVLWVEDQPDRVSAQIKAISNYMETEGFEFKATLCTSVTEVRERLAPDVFRDEIDLIVVDWDLGGGLEGQTVIAEIRGTVQYKDIVFYSAHTRPEQLRELAFRARLEGIYCAAREGLVEEVIGVFDSLVKKVLDLDHTRGIVMGATSDIDNIVNECLLHIHSKLDQAGQRAMLVDALNRADVHIKDLTKKATKLKGSTTLAELFNAHMLVTANDRLRILHEALQTQQFEAHRDAAVLVSTYIKKVVPDRNILGHLVLVPEGKPKAVVDNTDREINVEQMRELRRLILSLRGNFRKLQLALQAGTINPT